MSRFSWKTGKCVFKNFQDLKSHTQTIIEMNGLLDQTITNHKENELCLFPVLRSIGLSNYIPGVKG